MSDIPIVESYDANVFGSMQDIAQELGISLARFSQLQNEYQLKVRLRFQASLGEPFTRLYARTEFRTAREQSNKKIPPALAEYDQNTYIELNSLPKEFQKAEIEMDTLAIKILLQAFNVSPAAFYRPPHLSAAREPFPIYSIPVIRELITRVKANRF